MELRVWVDGVSRVVCGLSPKTPCQHVVVALAQAIGQTGRYVLVSKLRGTERALVADDCPLQHVAQMGQLGTEVQFVLRRTGPSISSGSGTPTTERRLQLHRPSEPPQLKRKEPHKALTFNLGPSTCPRRNKAKTDWSPSPRASPEPRASPVLSLDSLLDVKTDVPSSTKEEVFRQVLLQRGTLEDLETQLQALERETEAWEEESSSPVPRTSPVSEGDLEELELRLMLNQTELLQRESWEDRLQEEVDRERDMNRRLDQIRSQVSDHDCRVKELRTRSAHLEEDLRLRVHRDSRRTNQGDDVLGPLKQELHHRRQQGGHLDAKLSETDKELRAAEERRQSVAGSR
ncbi:ras association domain-containing protein 8-like isoform X2 [Brachionichthys hirsutus]|uniref:ras association domain-containing protein 8-like isoform X2 n=1 Tax=Brachionichthys hirsutus TaxID=412623 RepID=UPI0036047C4B